jgi:hypothetical protein
MPLFRHSASAIAPLLLLALVCAHGTAVVSALRGKFPPPSPTILPKVFPSNAARNFTCPPNLALRNGSAILPPPGYFPSVADINQVPVNQSLADIVPEVANLSNALVILVKRAKSSGGQPDALYFKYYGFNENLAIETWSSSKVFAVMNGAGHMRQTCANTLGLDSSTQGKYSALTPLGDLGTVIVSYTPDYSPDYSSNSLGGWFNVLGGRSRARDMLIRDWMLRPAESLGANYGATPPSDLKFSFVPSCSVRPDTPANDGFSNTLSALTAAELVKRIVYARELPAAQRFPNTTWADSETLLYGAKRSVLFPSSIWGGMSCNGDDLLRLGVDVAQIEQRSKGKWRTFSKDGAGYSMIRLAGEELFNGAACFSDAENPENGVEYVLSTRVSVPGDRNLEVAGKRMHAAMAAINQAILSGRLA